MTNLAQKKISSIFQLIKFLKIISGDIKSTLLALTFVTLLHPKKVFFLNFLHTNPHPSKKRKEKDITKVIYIS